MALNGDRGGGVKPAGWNMGGTRKNYGSFSGRWGTESFGGTRGGKLATTWKVLRGEQCLLWFLVVTQNETGGM